MHGLISLLVLSFHFSLLCCWVPSQMVSGSWFQPCPLTSCAQLCVPKAAPSLQLGSHPSALPEPWRR